MKIMKFGVLGTILFVAGLPANAAVTYEIAMGAMRDTTGTALPDNTLVVLIANTDDTAGLPGGLNDSDLSKSGLDPAQAFADFAGKKVEVGDVINGDTVFYVGQINSSANYLPAGMLYEPSLSFSPSYPPNLAKDQTFGIYWFPGRTSASDPLPSDSFDMGGFFNSSPNTSQSDVGMILQDPNSGGTYKIYQMDSETASSFSLTSATSSAAFSAITVPEPSGLLLGALGGLFLLRRRRS